MDLPWFVWLESFEHLPAKEKASFRLMNREWAASINCSLYNLLTPEDDLLKRIGKYAKSIVSHLEIEYLKLVKEQCPRLAHIAFKKQHMWVSAKTLDCFEIVAAMPFLISLSIGIPFYRDTLFNIPLGTGLKMITLDLSGLEMKEQVEYISCLNLPNLIVLHLNGLIPSPLMLHYSKLCLVKKVRLQYKSEEIMVTKTLIPPIETLEKATIEIKSDRPSHQLPDPKFVPNLVSVAFITPRALELFRKEGHIYPSVKHLYLDSSFNMLGKIQKIFPNCVSFELFLGEGKMPNLSHDIEGIKWLNLSLDPRNVFKIRLQVESLTTLSIHDTLFSWAISCLPNLQHLRLSGSKLLKATKLPPDNLKSLPSLLTLYIIGQRDDAYYRKLLTCLPNLEHIYSNHVAKNKTTISKVSPNVKVHAYVPMENIIKYHGA